MHDLKTTTAVVKRILENDTHARNSDTYLYLKVIERTANLKGIDLENLTVPQFLLLRDELGFEPFETVRRTRQKVQEHNPDLAACETVKEFRTENESAFLEYARNPI